MGINCVHGFLLLRRDSFLLFQRFDSVLGDPIPWRKETDTQRWIITIGNATMTLATSCFCGFPRDEVVFYTAFLSQTTLLLRIR